MVSLLLHAETTKNSPVCQAQSIPRTLRVICGSTLPALEALCIRRITRRQQAESSPLAGQAQQRRRPSRSGCSSRLHRRETREAAGSCSWISVEEALSSAVARAYPPERVAGGGGLARPARRMARDSQLFCGVSPRRRRSLRSTYGHARSVYWRAVRCAGRGGASSWCAMPPKGRLPDSPMLASLRMRCSSTLSRLLDGTGQARQKVDQARSHARRDRGYCVRCRASRTRMTPRVFGVPIEGWRSWDRSSGDLCNTRVVDLDRDHKSGDFACGRT
jgi:hypothetical protein